MTEAKRVKILNVEDSEVDRMALARTVGEKGLAYDLDHAPTLARARELLGKQRYNVVLIDYRLPDGTGLELLKEINHIPSIFVTGSGDETVAVKAMKGGAYDYVIKDSSAVYLEFLPTTIEKVLGVYNLEQERKRTVETLHRAYAQLAGYKTELEGAYNKLKESEERLVQSAKMASLGEMGAGIAHELNSPLAGILSLSEVLMKRIGKENPNYSFLEKIADAAIRSKKIILDLLTYSQPRTDEFKPLCINETIKSTLTLFVSEIKTSPLEIKEDLEPHLPLVLGNKGQLMEVLYNVLKNARDALDSSGTITIKTKPIREGKGDFVMVEIKDTGPGIPDEIRDRIFDPFFTTKEKGGGLNIGLGLSICRGIVKAHGGRVEVESTKGKGSTFRVILPAAGQ
jgi:signal transduction histidine kinase